MHTKVMTSRAVIWIISNISAGHKVSVHTHRNYLVIVSPPFAPSATAASATVRNFVAQNASADGTDIAKVVVFDLENKLVAYSGTSSGIRDVFSANGQVYLLTNDGKVRFIVVPTCIGLLIFDQLNALEEKPTSAKLDLLYRKSLYLLALNLAKTQHLNDASVADIHRQYGDHLYIKGDYDGAMQQFVQTIGHVQPSYVIRKVCKTVSIKCPPSKHTLRQFLDAQRIHNLVTYLQELHNLGLANSDHTTLLLNTYTKLKDVVRLDSFIKTESRRVSADGETEELPSTLR